jgi:hypothetical protein
MATSTGSVATMHPSREHAIHNAKACRYLADHSGFSDWVITTAFYSALHWINYHLFPHTETDGRGNPIMFEDFDQYLMWRYSNRFRSLTPHKTRIDLVDRECPAISAKYRSLHDTCRTARYVDYKVGQKLATKAIKSLEEITKLCDHPKP